MSNVPPNEHGTSVALPDHLDAVCDRFEAAWEAAARGDPRPGIEDYLNAVTPQERRLLARELVLLDVYYRGQRGESPRLQDYLARFPDLDPHWLARHLTSPPTSPGSARTPSRLRCPHCANPIQLADQGRDEVLCPGCGSHFRIRDAKPTRSADPSRPLGKFQLIERVGGGAFGAVWKARDTTLGRIVALKIPHAGLLTEGDELQRFQREARAAAQLRHPGIVPVHEVVTLDGLPCLVSEFVLGVTLEDLLEVRRLTFREAALLLAEVAEAVHYAHTMGVIHRDLKPANLMLQRDDGEPAVGRPRVMDFGMALRAEAEETLTQEGHVLGTPAYMSPEQAQGKGHQADARSDVYSLGILLYELLTGEVPFRGSQMMILFQVLHDEPRPPCRLNDQVPWDLQTICLKALAKNPRDRYPTAQALAEDLTRWLRGEPIEARPAGRLERLVKWAVRKPAQAAVYGLLPLVLLLGAAGLGTGWLWQRAEQARGLETQARE